MGLPVRKDDIDVRPPNGRSGFIFIGTNYPTASGAHVNAIAGGFTTLTLKEESVGRASGGIYQAETMAPGMLALSSGTMVVAGSSEEEYNSDMVALLLRLDAEAPEAVFDNFKDLMDDLDRD